MQDILVSDIAKHLGTEVRLKGWVRNIRHSGKLIFIIFREGSAEIQAVAFKPELGEESFEEAKRLGIDLHHPHRHPHRASVKSGVYDWM
jgi:asparaginyl-tRNA synthetase